MALDAGQTLGCYSIVAPLGAGGMGEVYRARDTKLDREVAIKVLPADVAENPERLQRFEREAKAVAALNHPNIVTIHAIEQVDDLHFIAMELVEGQSLDRVISSGDITLAKIFDLTIPLADALASAHDKGIVHRDLKPGNVMVTKEGRVKILDFGLAKLTNDDQEGSSPHDVTLSAPLTGRGVVIGTVPYMSPEQLQGEPVDHRTDLFALGVMLYELATGQRPFQGKNSATITSSILRDEPAPVQELNTAMPRHLARIVNHCLEKDPEHRYQSAKDVRNALRALRKEVESGSDFNEPVAVALQTTQQAPGTSATSMSGSALSAPTRRGEFWLGVTAVIVVLVAGFWFLRDSISTKPQNQKITATSAKTNESNEQVNSLAVLPFAVDTTDAEAAFLGEGIAESVINRLLTIPQLRVISRNTAFRHSGREQELDKVATDLNVRSILTGRVLSRGNRLIVSVSLEDMQSREQIWGDRFDRELTDILDLEREMAEHIASALRVTVGGEQELDTESPEARLAFMRGRFFWNKRTPDGFKQALREYDHAIRLDPTYAQAHAGKASTYALMASYSHRPKDVIPLAKHEAQRAIALAPDLSEPYTTLAYIQYKHEFNWREAEASFQKAIQLDPSYATAHQWYGDMLLCSGRVDEGEAAMKKAQSLDPGSLIIATQQFIPTIVHGDLALAESQARHTLELDPTFAPTLFWIVNLGIAQGRFDEAIQTHRDLAKYTNNSPWVEGLVGYALGLAGRRAEAQKELDRLERESTTRYIPARAIALVHAGLGDLDRAFSYLDQAIDDQDPDCTLMTFDPIYNPIRQDPRFSKLIRRLGLQVKAGSIAMESEVQTMLRLAVLPFKNLGLPEDEYFSDGISDEIRSRLAKVKKLDVISRSSAFQYRNTQKTIRQIGDELGVDYVIDGTIRWDKRGGGSDRVRITPELVRIADDVSLWSQPYNRSLDDIFEVQSEIATQVFGELRITLLGSEQEAIDQKPTANTDAYEAYLRGLNYLGRPDYTESNYRLAIQMFDRAIQLDPEFALAYAKLSKSHAWLVHEGYDRSQARMNQSKRAADRALALQPNSPESHVAQAEYFYRCHRNNERALQMMAVAEKLRPNDSKVLELKASILRRQGKFEQALGLFRRSFELNPRSPEIAISLSETTLLLDQFDQSQKWSDRALALDPDQITAYHLKAEAYFIANGDLESSRKVLEEMPRKPNSYAVISWFRQQLFEGHYDAALSELDAYPGGVLEMQNRIFTKQELEARVYRAMGEESRAKSAEQSALAILDDLVSKHPDDHRIRSARGIVLAGLGRKDEAIREGMRGIELFPESKDAWIGPHRVRDLAYIYTLLGEHDLAMDRIEYLLSIAWDDLSIPLLRIDPRWNPLRNHPRYRKLMIANGYDLEIPPSPKRFSLPDKTTLAVLPFDNISSDPDTDYLSNEIPANLIDAMSALSGLNTISRSGTFRFDSQKEDATRFGQKLGATVVMTGQINARGNNLTIRAELVDVKTNKQIWSKRYPRELTDIMAVEKDITQSISEALRLQLSTDEKSKLARTQTVNPDAYRYYLEGRYWWNKRTAQGFDKAIRQYDRAIEIDPNFARAYAGKAESYALMAYYTHPPKEAIPLAKRAAQRAIELDPTMAAPYTTLAYLQHIHEHDFASSEKNFQKAIQLNPGYATAHQWYGTALLSVGRINEAEDRFEEALRLDPGSLIIHRNRSRAPIHRREFDVAEARLRETLELDPYFPPALYHLVGVYVAQRRLDEAIEISRTISQYSGNAATNEGLLGYVLGLAGRTAEAKRDLERLEREATKRYIPANAFAMVYAGLGDFDRAFAYFDQAFDDQAGEMASLKFNPIYDPLRHDPRFDRLIERIGFPDNRPNPVAENWIPKPTKLAILPFANVSHDPDTDYLSNEIPANLIDTMSALAGLHTISRSGTFRFDPREEDATEFGQELGATVVLTGQINARGRNLTIRAELVDVSTNKQLWSKRYPRELTDILDVEKDITQSITQALRLHLTTNEETQLARSSTINPDARLAYMQGRYWWNKRSLQGFERSLAFYDQAIQIDPSYALAHAGQAATYAMMGAYTHRPKDVIPLAEKAAQRAIELDPNLAEAHTTLAWIQGMYHREWEEAEQTFKRALELNPKFANAHQWYSVLHAVRGQLEESVRRAETARQLEPNSLIINLELAWNHSYQGDYTSAQKAFQRILEMEHTFAPARYGLGIAYLMSRKFDEAIREFRLARTHSPENTRQIGFLGYALGLAGRRMEALAELKRIEALAKNRYVPNVTFGHIYAGLGDLDRAFEYLNKACDEREVGLAWIAVGPSFHPLRHDPRFDRLMERIGIPGDRPHLNVEHWIPEPTTLAVLPFDNVSRDPDTDYLSNEIPASIIDTMSRLSGLRVIARSGSFRFDSTRHDPSSVGQSLGASVVLTGQINARENELTIRAELVDVQTSQQLWSKRYSRELTDIMDVEQDITQNISNALKLHLTHAEQTDLSNHAGINAQAYKALLQGRFWHHKFNLAAWKKSLRFFQEAVRIDPNSAIAHAELSKKYSALCIWFGDMRPAEAAPKAKHHATTAIALDETLGEAHVAHAFYLLFHGWDWPAAEAAFKRAIQLEPDSSEAHIRYAILLRITRRLAESEAMMMKAQELDPTLAMNFVDMGSTYQAMARYDDSIEECRKALILDPQFAPAFVILGVSYLAKEMYDEAIRHLEKYSSFMNRQVDDLGYLGSAYAFAGNRPKAMEILSELRARPSFGRGHVASARIHAGLGDLDSAFDHLGKAFAEHDPGLIFLNTDIQFEPLRSDPRYADLAKRMGFVPKPAMRSSTRTQNRKIMLAVLPFVNLSNDSEQEYFSDGMTEELITRLGRLSPDVLRVIARTSAMRYKNSEKSIADIGSELGVSYIVEGGVRQSGNTVRINAQLIQVSDQTQLWGDSFTRELSDIFAVQTEVTESVAQALSVELLPEVKAAMNIAPTESSAAHNEYLLGRHYWSQRTAPSIQTAIGHFERAVELDPDYALAYSGLADAWGVLRYYTQGDFAEMLAKSESYARRAIELGPSFSESNNSMAMVLSERGHFQESLPYADKAIEFDPNNATARQWYALTLALLGRADDAQIHFERGIALDPQSAVMRAEYGDSMMFSRRLEKAIEQFKISLEIDPSFLNAYGSLAWAYIASGREVQAAEAFKHFLRGSGQSEDEIAVFQAGFAEGGYCNGIRNWLHRQTDNLAFGGFSVGDRASLHAWCGENDIAFDLLDQALNTKDPELLYLGVSLAFDRIRNDPRWAVFIKRAGLE